MALPSAKRLAKTLKAIADNPGLNALQLKDKKLCPPNDNSFHYLCEDGLIKFEGSWQLGGWYITEKGTKWLKDSVVK